MKIRVRVQNWYSCGQESQSTVSVEPPAELPDDDWWEEVVFDHTGDGHWCGGRDTATYTATVLTGEHAGASMEWG